MTARPLELQSAIGFSGQVKSGLMLHPSDKYIIYSLGSTVVIRNVEDQTDQTFLQAHTQRVTCMAISKDGNRLATGQIQHMGYLADAIIWDVSGLWDGGSQPNLLHKLSLHKVMVQSLAFSASGEYLASIGGEDDNNLVIWSVEEGLAICGSPASHDVAFAVKWLNCSDTTLVTGGAAQLRVWDFDVANRKVRPTECNMGRERRSYTCIAVSDDDAAIYVGTSTGDIAKVDTLSKRLVQMGPRKRVEMGVQSIVFNHKDGELIVGSGAGQLVCVSAALERLGAGREGTVQGCVTSIALDQLGEFFFAGTDQSNMYLVPVDAVDQADLKGTAHYNQINDVAFPAGYSELFATCGGAEIRVWHGRSTNELMRVQVPNLECNCLAFPRDGTAILSGWSDGKIRSFGPQSGNLKYVINEAHQLTGVGNSSGGVVPKNGVTSICPTHDGKKLVSGGADGKVRVWAVSKGQQVMLASMQEHKGPISSIVVNEDDSMCVSASADGSCIVWQLAGMMPYVRQSALFAANFFKAAVYGPQESQLLTCGTDRKITYWDVTNMQPIRILDGSETAEVNTLAISAQDPGFFVSGGSDKKVVVWNYDEGSEYYEGSAHSGAVAKVVIAPDEKTIISVGTEGAVCIWTAPTDVA
mmetsp:Transcript_24667/g.53859  ORF Transcript_24667/g.53859 Transcript_24667/m.53859 type:complete len:640 (-) Transcript_24667:151-2070(-)